jgi:hypothetical protein
MRQHTLENHDPWLTGRSRLERAEHLCHATHGDTIDERELA